MTERYEVVVAAGSLRAGLADGVDLSHRWTAEGVRVLASFTGAHLLHLSVAGCVLNDVYREAPALGVQLDGVVVRAAGSYDPERWSCDGIDYQIEVSSTSPAARVADLLQRVDEVAEIPRAVRAGVAVRQVSA